MMITPTMVGPVRTGLINALGREYPIRALISNTQPALVAGVVEASADRFLPFTVGAANDVHVWEKHGSGQLVDVVYALFDLLSDLNHGSRKNPHG